MINYPHYDRNQRRRSFERLPKGAYVLVIKAAEEFHYKDGGDAIKIYFDIAEGEYLGFYQKQYNANTSEDKKWPMDANYLLRVPNDNSEEWVWKNWNSFMADLEDSNNGYVFDNNLMSLRGRLIGGLFRNEQSEYQGKIYDHTRLYWSATVEDVREGTYGKLPKDKVLEASTTGSSIPASNDWMSVPAGADEKLPF